MQPASSVFPPDRYSAKKMVKPVNFVCLAPGAKRVCLTGDFNRWNSESHALQQRPDGAWFLQVPLCHGHHQYLFLVDGEPVLDPRANGTARDHKGDRVSLIAVS
jgi:1,4-alpha-glucan branching enzyme